MLIFCQHHYTESKIWDLCGLRPHNLLIDCNPVLSSEPTGPLCESLTMLSYIALSFQASSYDHNLFTRAYTLTNSVYKTRPLIFIYLISILLNRNLPKCNKDAILRPVFHFSSTKFLPINTIDNWSILMVTIRGESVNMISFVVFIAQFIFCYSILRYQYCNVFRLSLFIRVPKMSTSAHG